MVVESARRGLRLKPARRAALAAAWASLLMSCAAPLPPAPPVDAGQAPADFPSAYYREAERRGEPVLRIDPGRSQLTVLVRCDGSLARLGHDHVVASHELGGYVAPEGGRADIHLRLDGLTVDEPELRAEAGLATNLAAETVAGTRRNMLEKVLEAASFPFVSIHATGRVDDSALHTSITLHGVTRIFDLPVHIDRTGSTLAASGQATIRQSDFGIVPLSILGGALQVRDELEMRFRIVATRG